MPFPTSAIFKRHVFLSRIIVLALLASCTFFVFHYVDFYQETGEELSGDGIISTNAKNIAQVLNQSSTEFPEPFQGVLLENNNPKQLAHITYTLPAPAGKYVRAHISMSTDNIPLGDKHWKTARAFIVSGDHKKWLWQHPHIIAILTGTNPLKDYSLVVAVPEQATHLQFSVQLRQTTGRVLINSVSLAIVEQDLMVQRCVQGLMLVWVITAIWVFYPLLASWRGRIVLLFGAGILSLILIPKSFKHDIIVRLSTLLKQTALPEYWLKLDTLSSVGHFSGFLCLSLITLNLFWKRFASVFALLIGLALLSELLQNFAIDRHANINDFEVDVLGILAAAGLVKLFCRKNAS